MLVWQLPIIEHKINRHGGRVWKWQHPLDKPHDEDDDVSTFVEQLCVGQCLSKDFTSVKVPNVCHKL